MSGLSTNQLLRKPLNILEQPIQPFIQKAPPRFAWSGRHDVVNVGEIMRQQETNTQGYDDAVLAVSRQENQYRYGQRSYHTKVNKEFRPPLIDPIFDLQPLSRLRRPATQARVNPGAPHIYKTQNGADRDVSSHIDDTRVFGAVRPSFGLKIEQPTDFEIVPDLEYNGPQVSAYSSKKIPLGIKAENGIEYTTLENHNPTTFGRSGVNPSFQERNVTALEELVLDPHTGAFVPSGISNVTLINNVEGYEDIELDSKLQSSAFSGLKGPYDMQTDTSSIENMELASKLQAQNVFTNPRSHIDKTDYTPQTTPIIHKLSVSTNSGGKSPYSTIYNNTPLHKRNIRPTMGYTGSFDSSRSASAIPQGVSAVPLPKLKSKQGMY
jgi:hypothetical protein